MPLVSVCCLAYNHSAYIRQCLDSILGQKTQFDIEVIINDDASSDNTVEIVREYAEQYPDIIKPICQVENQFSKGVNMLNYVFSMAKGKYIAICECDDYWTDPYKLQKQVDILEEDSSYGCVYTGYKTVDTNGDDFDFPPSAHHLSRSFSGDIFSALIYGNFPQTLTVLFRRELLEMPIDCCLGVDYSLFLKLALQKNFYFLQDKTGAYRINPNGLIQSGAFAKYDIKGLVTYYYSQYIEHKSFRRPLVSNLKIHLAFLRSLCNYSNLKKNTDLFKRIIRSCWGIAVLIPFFCIKNELESRFH